MLIYGAPRALLSAGLWSMRQTTWQTPAVGLTVMVWSCVDEGGFPCAGYWILS